VADTSPHLQADMLRVIERCATIITLATRVRSAANSGKRRDVHATLKRMAADTQKLDDLVRICADTTDHWGG
jgi:hypothetical protein